MITTLLLAIAGWVGTNALAAKPATMWHTDYGKAITVAAGARKPMAVFLGQGIERLERMMQDGTIPEDAVRVLQEYYVVVALDSTSAAGRDLANRYSMPEGLIINDSNGSVQALRHGGAVSGAGLTADLVRYSQAVGGTNRIVTAAGSNFILGSTCSNGQCRNTLTATTGYAKPITSYPTNQVAGMTAVPTPVFRYTASPANYPHSVPLGGCANGRCPNQR